MSEDVRQLLGMNIRKLRLKAGLSQEALGYKVGVDRAYVSLLERGKQNATILTLWDIAQALGVKVHTLLLPTRGTH